MTDQRMMNEPDMAHFAALDLPTSRHGSAGKRLRILAWPLSSPANVYAGALNDELARQADVEAYSPGRKMCQRIMRERFDILHIHWLERAFWSARPVDALKFSLWTIVNAALLRARGGKLVWTVHDPEPHAMASNAMLHHGWTRFVWRFYRACLVRMMDGVLLLSANHRDSLIQRFPRLGRVASAVTPHPHYRGQYADEHDRQSARQALDIAADKQVIAFVGSLRTYKNPDGLIEAFRRTDAEAVLLIAGAPQSAEFGERLRGLAEGDKRIRLNLGFVRDDDLGLWLRAADLAIFPYRNVTNSGSALLALSFDLPLVVPDEPVFDDLAEQVGEAWIRRYTGDLTPDILTDALEWARPSRAERPDLSARDWAPIAESTLRFFGSLFQDRAGGTATTR